MGGQASGEPVSACTPSPPPGRHPYSNGPAEPPRGPAKRRSPPGLMEWVSRRLLALPSPTLVSDLPADPCVGKDVLLSICPTAPPFLQHELQAWITRHVTQVWSKGEPVRWQWPLVILYWILNRANIADLHRTYSEHAIAILREAGVNASTSRQRPFCTWATFSEDCRPGHTFPGMRVPRNTQVGRIRFDIPQAPRLALEAFSESFRPRPLAASTASTRATDCRTLTSTDGPPSSGPPLNDVTMAGTPNASSSGATGETTANRYGPPPEGEVPPLSATLRPSPAPTPLLGNMSDDDMDMLAADAEQPTVSAQGPMDSRQMGLSLSPPLSTIPGCPPEALSSTDITPHREQSPPRPSPHVEEVHRGLQLAELPPPPLPPPREDTPHEAQTRSGSPAPPTLGDIAALEDTVLETCALGASLPANRPRSRSPRHRPARIRYPDTALLRRCPPLDAARVGRSGV